MEYNKRYKKLQMQWRKLKSENKKIRIRDAAFKLNSNEGELLSTEIDENTFLLSIDNYREFLKLIFKFSNLMFLVRNDIAVHEKIIKTKDYILNENIIISIDKKFLLQIQLDAIKFSFYSRKINKKISLRSFQFFDDLGNSILKIYLKSDEFSQFDNLGQKYKIHYNYQLQKINQNKPNNNKHLTLNDIKSDHNLSNYILIDQKKYNGEIFRLIIELLSKKNILFQIIIINKFAIQYHIEEINKIIDFEPWFNIMDKNFNLHILEKNIEYVNIKTFKQLNNYFYVIEIFDEKNVPILALYPYQLANDFFSKTIRKYIIDEY